MKTSLEEMLFAFDMTLPVDEALTPPGSWYRSSEFFDLEMNTVFSNRWVCIGVSQAFQKSGDYLSVELGAEPIVVVRGRDGVLRAFYNVCQHHASCLVEGQGRIKAFICPYHGWTYGLNGRLVGTPGLGAVKHFDRDDFSLKPLLVQEWMGFVFVSQSDSNSDSLDKELTPLKERLRAHGGQMKHHLSRTYDLDCNWKVFADNYLDGGYHVSRVHPDLAGNLSLQTYQTESFQQYSIQSCRAKGGERLGQGATYAYVHPNLMINRYGPVLDSNILLPLGPENCRVVFDYFFDESLALSDSEKDSFIASSHSVQVEDMSICRSVQKGLRSRGYVTGRYSPDLEVGMHAFHCDLAKTMRAGFKDD